MIDPGVTPSSSQPSAAAGGSADAAGFPEVFGKYVLLRPMARGGMGELFIAAAGETGGFEKLCVVKKVLANLDDAGVYRRFLDEAKVVVRLNHSNLVQVFDAGKIGNEYYLSMELVEGKDLRAVWNRCAQLHRRIPVDVAIFVIREVARGLSYVHDAMGLDLVHRDISPPNILVGYHGDVKLTDFGLAKSAIKREMTNPGVVFGRYSYLSPEQARGLPADRRTDIYAAAIVLWELLTGRQLFPSSNRSHQEALAAVRNPVIRKPSEVVPGVPPGLDEVVLAGLEPDRDARFSTGAEFRSALSDVLVKHYPSCDADRVSEFMRDIFAREIKLEAQEYGSFARQDFSEIRSAAQQSEAISISDVIFEGGPESTIPLSDADIVELEEQEPGDVRSVEELREEAQAWIGKVVAKRYRVHELIGIGGMGAVFKVTHLVLGKRFALKILHDMYTRDPEIITRFMREARAATQTGHPNIIDVIDIGQAEDGEVYFVMELLEGDHLGNIVRRDGPFAIRRAVHVASQICRALAAAHEVGIIHRDLKSENVLLTMRGKDPDFVKVLDFGICKQVDAEPTERTTPGLVMGSPDYMAPEQAAGLDVAVGSDVYAVGCMLFEMLSGQLPYSGRNAIEVLMKKSSVDAPMVTTLRPEVPAPLADVVRRCLARRPEDRPASMRVLEYELTRAVDGRASAVAAVLGLSAPPEPTGRPDEDDPAGSSARLDRAEFLGDSPTSGAIASQLPSARDGSNKVAVPVAAAQPREGQSRLGGGLKALFFASLGGLLVAGVAFVINPGAVASWFDDPDDESEPDEAAADAQPSAANPPRPTRAPVVARAAPPKPEPKEAAANEDTGGLEPTDGAESAAAIVERAEKALAAQHWREPPEGSLAIELANLNLLDPSHEAISTLRRRAADELLPEGEKLAKKREWLQAANVYRDLVAVWPDNAVARQHLGETLLNQGRLLLKEYDDYERALLAADELLNLDSESADARVLRANSLFGLGQWDKAAEAYGEAVELRPRDRSLRKRQRVAVYRASRAKAREEAEARDRTKGANADKAGDKPAEEQKAAPEPPASGADGTEVNKDAKDDGKDEPASAPERKGDAESAGKK